MRTPEFATCAPAGRRKARHASVLRLAVLGGRGRSARSGWAGSDPPVRGTAAGSGPCAFAHPRPLPLGSLPDQRSLRGKAVRAPLRGGGQPVRRPADRRALPHRRARPGRVRQRLAVAFPHGTAGWERPRGSGEDGAVRLNPPRCRSRHGREGGLSHPRPRSADRHRRSARRGATESTPATWTVVAVSDRTAISCPATPKVCRTTLDRHRERRKSLAARG